MNKKEQKEFEKILIEISDESVKIKEKIAGLRKSNPVGHYIDNSSVKMFDFCLENSLK